MTKPKTIKELQEEIDELLNEYEGELEVENELEPYLVIRKKEATLKQKQADWKAVQEIVDGLDLKKLVHRVIVNGKEEEIDLMLSELNIKKELKTKLKEVFEG